MRKNSLATMAIVLIILSFATVAFAKKFSAEGYILEHEKELASDQSGPHNGGGNTTAYSFFAAAKDCNIVFRKRILHPGAAIGYHFQGANEIYYIISGTGEMKMNDKVFAVQAGDAILTLPGSSHGLTQTGKDDLVMIINYEKK